MKTLADLADASGKILYDGSEEMADIICRGRGDIMSKEYSEDGTFTGNLLHKWNDITLRARPGSCFLFDVLKGGAA